VVVRVGGRPRHIRRTYLIVFLLLLLLLLSCCCLLYTDILPMPAVVIDILGPFTPVVPGCGLGLVLIFICYIIIILFKLDFNCIYVPVGLLIMVVLCVILNIIGVVPLPDFVDRIVVVVTGPIRTLPLPWDPGPGNPRNLQMRKSHLVAAARTLVSQTSIMKKDICIFILTAGWNLSNLNAWKAMYMTVQVITGRLFPAVRIQNI